MTITKETTIAEVIANYPKKLPVLQKHLHAMCLGCPGAQLETLEEAAAHHGIEIQEMIKELNQKE